LNWLQAHKRSALIIALTLAIPVLLYFYLLLGLLDVRQGYQLEIDRLEPRIARLQGLKGYEDQLRVSAERVAKRTTGLAYPVTNDATAVATSLQSTLRQIVIDAGLSVTNSQVLQPREEGVFEYVGLKLTVNGPLAGLDEVLAGIAQYRPLLIVESLDVWPVRVSLRSKNPAQQKMNATLQLLSLRVAQ
jgi:general secretion pathway protein M